MQINKAERTNQDIYNDDFKLKKKPLVSIAYTMISQH